jgi:hypothetical protein
MIYTERSGAPIAFENGDTPIGISKDSRREPPPKTARQTFFGFANDRK